MNSFLKYLANRRQDLTRLESQVLDFIIDQPESIINASITDVANLTFVSTATISRTCKKLGFNGFLEFKYELLKSQNKNNVTQKNTLSSHSANEYIQQVQLTLKNNEALIDAIDFDMICSLLKNSQKVELFGIGRSYSTCQEAAQKLSFAGCLANARSDWDELRSITRFLNPDDLAILISLSGETLHIMEFASLLSKNNVPTLALIGCKGSSLSQIVDYRIELDIKSVKYKNIDMSSQFIFSIVFDIFAMKYLESF